MVETVAMGIPPLLDELGASVPVALFLDFDGTLVDIAPSPDAIRVPPDLPARLEALARRMEGRLALVSGRSVADIERHLGPVRIALAGSHGLDRIGADGARIGPAPAPIPRAAMQAFEDFAARSGLEYEAKSHGAALHYRTAPALADAALAFAREIADENALQLKRGKCVVELAPQGADKAGAVHAFMGEGAFAGAMPVFVGDDITDEDGFLAARDLGGFGIIVGDRAGTLARYRLPSPTEVSQWLEL